MKTITLARGSGLLITAVACLLAAGADGQGGDVDATRAAIQERLAIERIISKEKLDWAIGQELLTSRVELTERQIDGLRAGIEESRAGVVDLERTKGELARDNETLAQASASLADEIAGLEARTRAVLERLPRSVQERVLALSQRIPADPDETDASLSERYMNVIGVLNQVNKFNREVSVANERHQLPDGSHAEVTVLYVGLGAAYYVTADETGAGIGRPGPDGWTWEPADEHVAAIANAIAIQRNEAVAAFVRLPVRID